MSDAPGTKEPDKVPDAVPDLTPDTPAEEAPVVPDKPKESTPVPDVTDKTEERLSSLEQAIHSLTEQITAIVPVAGLPTPDEAPKSKPWTHKMFGSRDS